jgi:hypothetical protein
MKNKSEISIKANIKMWKLPNVSYDEAKELIKGRKADFNKHNIIVTVGRAILAGLLAGDATYTGEINYGALGTAVSPVPANSDTELGNEVFRKIVASQSFENNVCYADFFYTAGDTDGTFTEFGNFIDGTASADSGQLFSHIATGGWSKTSSESLFVSCKYEII